MKILVLNQKIIVSIFTVMLLVYGIQTPSYGTDDPLEIDGPVNCRATYLRDHLFEVWVFGTIHAIRDVRSLTVTAYINDERIGENALGNLFADDYVTFSIVGIHEIPGHEGFCSIEFRWDESDASDTDDTESDDTGVPTGTIYDTGDSIPDSFGVFNPTSSYTLGNRKFVQVNDRAYTCISPGGCSIQGGTVTQGTIEVSRIDWSGASDLSELAVFPVSVSKSTLSPGEDFTLSATVRNQGKVRADGTTLRYYRSTDTTISSSDTEVGTDSVSGLDANEMSDKRIRLTAPTSAGVYYYGACVDPVNEFTTDNNCSNAVQITVEPPPESDLVVDQPTVSQSTLAPGENFTLSATVRNAGAGRADGTTLRYYRSTDATITTSDTEVGTDSVSGLGANESTDYSISLTASTSPGVYYYGACVDTVDNETATANNCSEAVSITVERVPTELVKISGDNQTGVIDKVLSSPFVVEVRDQDGTPFEGVTVMFAVTAGDGMLSVTTATTDAAGLAETALTLGSTPGANTVLATVDGIPQGVTFNAMGEGIEFNLSLPADISLIHVPLRVTAVDGTEQTIKLVSDLYDALGGASKVIFLATHDPQTQQWVGYFGPADKGTPADKPLTDDTGILANMIASTSVHLTGTPLGTNGTSTITLTSGFNVVGLPLRNSGINRVSDLLTFDGIKDNVQQIIFTDGGDWKLVTQMGDPSDVPIVGGQAFMLYAQQEAMVEISGQGWDNTAATAAAPPVGEVNLHSVTDTTSVLGLKGSIVDEAMGLNQGGFRVTVKNLSTGKAVTPVTGHDETGYRHIIVDIETGRAATVGDILEISAQSFNPFIGVQPLRYTVTAEDVKQSLIQLPELLAYEIPAETQLLANYPNPFNPETWIPYRLAEDAFVTLTIYDGEGRIVRSLNVGYQVAGVYESRSKAVYWDGRNEFGEQVASGVYFYHLSAGDYSATRKMLILK